MILTVPSFYSLSMLSRPTPEGRPYMNTSFAQAIRQFFTGVSAKELSEFMKACTNDDRKQFASELSGILGCNVTFTPRVE